MASSNYTYYCFIQILCQKVVLIKKNEEKICFQVKNTLKDRYISNREFLIDDYGNWK